MHPTGLLSFTQFILEQGSSAGGLLIVGDSNSVDTPTSWSRLVKAQLPKVKVVAEVGKSTSWMLERLRAELAKGGWDKVVVWGGTNDAYSGVPIERTLANLQEAADLSLQAGASPYLVVGWHWPSFSKPGAVRPNRWTGAKELERLRSAMIELQSRMAGLQRATLIPAFQLDSSYTQDGVHANAAGHRLAAEQILTALRGAEPPLDWAELASGQTLQREARPKRSSAVQSLQRSLMRLGYPLPVWGADGLFGAETEAAVRAFQQDRGLRPTGVADPATLAQVERPAGLNEAVLLPDPERMGELRARLAQVRQPLSREELRRLLDDTGVLVLDWQGFWQRLSPAQRRGAPQPGRVPFFAMLDPLTDQPAVVLDAPFLPPMAFPRLLHMLGHELVHVEQLRRRPAELGIGGWDLSDREAYFSDPDEVMAFSHSIADELLSMGVRTPAEGVEKLRSVGLWREVQRWVKGPKVLNRYRKYVWLYLQQAIGS